jgi:hypothetical protein
MKIQIQNADKKIQKNIHRTANPQKNIYYILALFLLSAFIVSFPWF